MVLFGFRCWYYGCWFLQVRESQTSFTFLFSKEFQTVCESLVPVIWGWIRKKRNHRGHLPYCWTVPRNLISPVRKFELQYKKMLIRRCFQTVFILYINKPTILHSIKLRLNEGKLKDAGRKLSSGSVGFNFCSVYTLVGWHGFRGSQRRTRILKQSSFSYYLLCDQIISNDFQMFEIVTNDSNFGVSLALFKLHHIEQVICQMNPNKYLLIFGNFLKLLTQQKISLFLISTSVMLDHCSLWFEMMELRPDECLRDSILEFQCIVSLYLSSRCSWKIIRTQIHSDISYQNSYKFQSQHFILLKLIHITFKLSMSLIVTKTTSEIIKRKTNIADKTKPIPSLSKNLISFFKKSEF